MSASSFIYIFYVHKVFIVQMYILQQILYSIMLSSNTNVHSAASQITIVKFHFHHVATQYPGHSTRFVTLPSSILLYWQLGQACHVWLFCKLIIVVVSTSSVVLSQVRWFFLLRNVFCTINHDEMK